MPEPTLTPAAAQPTSSSSRLLLVTGPGRSGTSAVTGALSQLGVHVPPPLVDWNRSNMKGFFETRWVVDFQRDVLAAAHTYEFDADPDAPERVQTVADDLTQDRLSTWLRGAADGHDQLVIKDPRSVWLHPLWNRAAESCDLTLCYLTMLRHPTEVVGSRSTYYGSAKDPRSARDYALSKVAGWINVSLLNERQTRGRPRAFVRYSDLLDDWRTALGRAGDAIGLRFNTDLTSREPNPVDEFISPDLHRIRTGWDELDVPGDLRDIAERTWAACSRLADEPETDLAAEFDALDQQYRRLYRDASAITSDTLTSAVSRARQEAEDRARREYRARLSAAESAVAGASGGKGPVVITVLRRARRFGRRAVRGVRRRLRR